MPMSGDHNDVGAWPAASLHRIPRSIPSLLDPGVARTQCPEPNRVYVVDRMTAGIQRLYLLSRKWCVRNSHTIPMQNRPMPCNNK